MSRIEASFCRSAPWRGFASRVVIPWALAGRKLHGDCLEVGAGSGAMAPVMGPGLARRRRRGGSSRCSLSVLEPVGRHALLLPLRDGSASRLRETSGDHAMEVVERSPYGGPRSFEVEDVPDDFGVFLEHDAYCFDEVSGVGCAERSVTGVASDDAAGFDPRVLGVGPFTAHRTNVRMREMVASSGCPGVSRRRLRIVGHCVVPNVNSQTVEHVEAVIRHWLVGAAGFEQSGRVDWLTVPMTPPADWSALLAEAVEFTLDPGVWTRRSLGW